MIKLIYHFSSISVAFYILRLQRIVESGVLNTWDTDVVIHCVKNNLVCIYPIQNQICNVGDDPNSTNLKLGNAVMRRATPKLSTTPPKLANVYKTLQYLKPKLGKKLYWMPLHFKIKLFVIEIFHLLRTISIISKKKIL